MAHIRPRGIARWPVITSSDNHLNPGRWLPGEPGLLLSHVLGLSPTGAPGWARVAAGQQKAESVAGAMGKAQAGAGEQREGVPRMETPLGKP